MLILVERQFAENALQGLHDPNNPSCWSALRSKMKEVAYHESGHIVAHMFTGLGSGDIVHVSIKVQRSAACYIKSISITESMFCEMLEFIEVYSTATNRR